MTHSWILRTVALTGVFWGMSWLTVATFGQMQNAQSSLHPCIQNCTPTCPPYGGYYQTAWRQWPGEQDLGQINPRAAVSEVIPTPQGVEQLPPPKTVPQQQQQQQKPSTLPFPLLPGTIRSPGGLLSPHNIPSEPDEKPESKSETPPTPSGGGLPVPNPSQHSPSESKPLNKPSSNSNPDLKTSFALVSGNIQGLSAPELTKVPRGSAPIGTAASQPSPTSPRAAATALQQSENRGVVSLASNVEPDRGVPARGVYRADPIGVATTSAAPAKVNATGYAEAASSATLMKPEAAAADTAVDDVPAAMPTVALGGFCPVELLSRGRWVQGSVQWTVVYDGHIYRFSGPEQRKQFLADSAVFAPVNSGNDTVLLVNENRTVSGLPAYCAVYNGRLFMFSSLATQAEFNNNPQRYVPAK